MTGVSVPGNQNAHWVNWDQIINHDFRENIPFLHNNIHPRGNYCPGCYSLGLTLNTKKLPNLQFFSGPALKVKSGKIPIKSESKGLSQENVKFQKELSLFS